jgi:hypothetical protein
MHMASDCIARDCDQKGPVAGMFAEARSVTDGNRPGLQVGSAALYARPSSRRGSIRKP